LRLLPSICFVPQFLLDMDSASNSSNASMISPDFAAPFSSDNSSHARSPPDLIPSYPRLHLQVMKVRAEDEHIAKAMEMLAFSFPSHLVRGQFCSTSTSSRPSPLGLSVQMPVWDSVQ
jgi:hypothetical protein